jgi:ribosome recycling factor
MSHLKDVVEGVFFDYYTRTNTLPMTTVVTVIKNDADEIIVELYKEDNVSKYPNATYYFDIPLLILSMNGLQLA